MIASDGHSAAVIPFSQAAEHFAELRRQGKTIVQCHGTFDLIHPGHIIHFEEARALGDVLVVTVTGEKFVNKGPGRPYFNDEIRARWLASLKCVDYVVLVPHGAAAEAIETVRPHIYCKGKEYEAPEFDVTGDMRDDVATVERIGGRMSYVGSVTFSSSRLLNQHFEPYPPDVKAFCQAVASRCPAGRFREMVDDFEKIRVAIIGDVIFDRYTTLQVQGLTSKNRILSGRFVSQDLQAGGALAVYRHLKQFAGQVKLVSLVGTELWLDDSLDRFVEKQDQLLVRSPEFTTVIKERFVEPQVEGKELAKLFSVNFVDRTAPSPSIQQQVIDLIAAEIDQVDLILVMDFGHGVLTERVREFVQDRARFLAVNCQTNSNNHGFNILNRRYHRADSFSLDETEMMLAMGRRDLNHAADLCRLGAELNATYGWLTRGAFETIGWKVDGESCACVPLERAIVDTLGAGDAFCALASLAAVSDVPLEVGTFMGQLAGAQAVRVVGNAAPVSKARLLRAAASMLAM